jgi:hypothetical protein
MKLVLFLLRFLIFLWAIFCLHGCVKTNPDDSNTQSNETPTSTPVGIPVGELATKTIGASGGSLTSADGKVELIIPQDALSDFTDISILPISNNAPNGIGNAYRLLPEGTKFSHAVTLKFHYTADNLASTLAELMGISFQDSAGFWHVLNDFSNDTAQKIISSAVSHFSDWTVFDFMDMSPRSASVKVNKNINLVVNYVGVDENNTGELVLLPPKKPNITWSANGIVNGNSTVGTLSGTDAYHQTFKAPAKVPSVNPVIASAEVPFSVTYNGVKYRRLLLISNITIVDGEKYLLEMKIRESFGSFVYSDSVSMVVVINNDDQVIVSEFTNFKPKTNMSTFTLGSCQATWIPDGIGETNVISAEASIDGISGDPTRNLYLQLTHTGAISPAFNKVCDGVGGKDPAYPISGLPSLAYFTLISGQSVYETDTGNEFDRLTLIQ